MNGMFDKVIFAGGGYRCWWQAGFWEVLRAEIELRPRVIGAVSAGAFMACLVHANDSRRALAWYERELAGVRTNMAWLNLFRRGEPLWRQGPVYRKAIRALLGGEHFRQLLWQAPEIRVLYALPPVGMTERKAAWRAWQVCRRDARSASLPLHGGTEGQGFRMAVKRLQDCRTEREMVDLIWASSCTPPMMAAAEMDGELAFDGGLIDPVPVRLVADVPGQTLVLTTRRYSKKTPVFASEGRIYVQPSVALPAAGWDITSPKRFQKSCEQGRRDAEAFLKLFGLGAFRQEDQFDGVMLAGAAWPGEAPLQDEEGSDIDSLLGDSQTGETDPAYSEAVQASAATEARAPAPEEPRPAAPGRAPGAGGEADAALHGGQDAGETRDAALAPAPPAQAGRVGAAVAGLAGEVAPQEDFQHTLGDRNAKLFERGRRRGGSLADKGTEG